MTSMGDLTHLDAIGQAELVRQGEVEAAELVEVTIDQPIDKALTHPAFIKSELTDENSVAITFDKDQLTAGEVLSLVQQQGCAIVDVTTREPDLEDVFVQLTREQLSD